MSAILLASISTIADTSELQRQAFNKALKSWTRLVLASRRVSEDARKQVVKIELLNM
jgi:hypothetical protein